MTPKIPHVEGELFPEEQERIGRIEEETVEPAVAILRPDLDPTTVTSVGLIPMILTPAETQAAINALDGKPVATSLRRHVSAVLYAEARQSGDDLAAQHNALEIILTARRAERNMLNEQIDESMLVLAVLGHPEGASYVLDGKFRSTALHSPNMAIAAAQVRRVFGTVEAANIFLDVLRQPGEDGPELPDDVMESLKLAIAKRNPELGRRLGVTGLSEALKGVDPSSAAVDPDAAATMRRRVMDAMPDFEHALRMKSHD